MINAGKYIRGEQYLKIGGNVMNIFSMDSAFYRFISRLGDLMILNILFLAGCLGIITIGPSLSAMYTVLLKMVRNKSGYTSREYWRAFRENFRQAAILWGISMVLGIVLYFDIMISDMVDGSAGQGMKIVFLFFAMVYFSVLSYLFAVQSRFANTIWNTVKNSFWMAVGYLPFTISVLVIEILPLFVILVRPQMFWYLLPVMLTVGFSVIGYVCAHIFNYIFKNYMPAEEESL